MTDLGTFKTIETDCDLFNPSTRLLGFGGSNVGKSYMLQALALKHHKKFRKIVVCGAKNILISHPSTAHKTVYHESQTDPIWDPFTNIDEIDTQSDSRGILIFVDDLMTESCNSIVLSNIFSKGRHLKISIILVLQSFFPQSTGRSLIPQIKNNSCVQVFFKLRNKAEMSLIAKKVECTKQGQLFFKSLIDKEVYGKRYGYIAIFLDDFCQDTMYRTNLLDEDKSGCETVFCKS